MRLGSKVGLSIPVISTGLAAFDFEVLQAGGIPRSRITEIFGPESAGKTTFVLHVIAQVQKAGGVAALVDAEHALDVNWAAQLGVDVDNLFICQPDNAEQGLRVAEQLVESGAVDLVVVDSVASLTPSGELEGEIGDAHVGLLARLMAQALRRIAGILNKGESKTALIFTNQIREKIGVMYGSPETQPGGRALRHYASVRIDVRRIGYLGADKEHPIGATLRLKAIKNKVGSPFRNCEVELYFPDAPQGAGFDVKGNLLDLAFARNVLFNEGNGTKYFFVWRREQKKGELTKETVEIAVGKAATKAAVLKDGDLYDAVAAETKRVLATQPKPAEEPKDVTGTVIA